MSTIHTTSVLLLHNEVAELRNMLYAMDIRITLLEDVAHTPENNEVLPTYHHELQLKYEKCLSLLVDLTHCYRKFAIHGASVLEGDIDKANLAYSAAQFFIQSLDTIK